MNDAELTVTRTREAWFIPGAIIVAGLILAVTVYATRANDLPGDVVGDPSLMRPVSDIDHIVGNPSAPVVLVEYADIDSAYTKSFQATMEQLMTEYGPSGNVAWVYRHLPLIDQHPYAAQHAEAAECVASLGGPTIFWRFISTLHAAAPDDQQFNPRNYTSAVEALGILPQSFESCMTDHRYQERVASDFANGIAIGAGGSPFSVLLVEGHPPVTIDGSVSYEAMKKILDEAIAESAGE